MIDFLSFAFFFTISLKIMLKIFAACTFRVFSPRIILCSRSYAANRLKRKKVVTTVKPLKMPMDEMDLESIVCPSFIARVVGLTSTKWSSVFKKHPELNTLNQQNVSDTVKILKALNYTAEDIYTKPTILLVGATTIENRYCVLQECGVQSISIVKLFKYITVMNKSITDLKAQQHIPYEMDVLKRLLATFTDIHIPLQTIVPHEHCEHMELKKLRELVLNAYFRHRLDMTEANIDKIWKSYSRVRHKSFQSVQSITKLLLEDLKFSKERIIKNAFLLYADPENVRRIMNEIPKIGVQDIRDIGYRRPKILMSNCDTLLKTLQHVKSFGINEEAVTRCLEMLTLGSDTVLERLKDLNQVEEFRVLATNPRVLRLVHYQNKARLRLEYLNQLKVRCASLHILSCSSEAFARFARDGSDRTKGRDIVVYLSNVMKRNENDIRNLMSRHPNWCHIPATHVKQAYEYLLSKKFSSNDIYHNIHLLLYPINRIDEKLILLHGSDHFESIQLFNININELSNNEILTLVLYLIECEFHFTGDGIWTEQHTQQMENFSNLLPDFPEAINKVYKYGVKPATSRKLDIQTTPR